MTELGMDIAEGTVLSGYRVERPLGRGATGTVYLARDDALDRQVALKLLAPDLARDPRFRERFLRESRIAAGLEHSGIVPIYAAGETEGTLFLAMRYVRGDLRQTIESAGRLEPAEALALLGQVGDALDTAHRAGLIHRDVKPANVLVEDDRAWLADFGLAKHAATVNSLSRDSGFAGTVSYIAPEQIQGGDVDGRADVYALGCVLFETLTGRAPYPRDNDLAVVFAHLREPPPSVSALRPELPESLDRVIAKALAKTPDERYRSCGELISEAQSAVGGGEVAAAPARSATVRTFLICDVRGYTRFTQQHGDEAAADLAAAFAGLVRAAVGEHEGRLIELRGDEALVVFESARGALRAALAIQQRVQDEDLARGVGIGLDAGEAVPVGAGYRGGALNMAARLCSLAEPGQVIASEAVTHLARNVEGARYLHGRIERLKGIEKPVRVVEVVTVQRGDALRGRLRRHAHGRRWLAPAAAVAVVVAVAAGILFGRGSTTTPALAAQIQPGSVGVFDAATHSLTKPIPLGGNVYDVVQGEGAIWAVVEGGTVVKIDPKRFTVEQRIAIGGEGGGLAVGAGAVWVSLLGRGAIVRIDPAFSTTTRIPLPKDVAPGWDPTEVGSIAAGDGSVWVAQAKRRVVRLDAATGAVEDKIPLPFAELVFRTPTGLYVLASYNGEVVKLDPKSGDRIWSAKLHPWLYDLASAGGIDWVVNNSDGSVFKIDDTSGQVVGSVPIQAGLSSVEAAGGAVWTDNIKAGTVSRIDTATGRKTTFPVGHAPTGLAIVGGHVLVGLIPSPKDELKGISGRVATFSIRENWFDGQTDPYGTWSYLGQGVGYATQAKLYNYPDKAGTAGGAPVPEVAAGAPVVSPDGRTVQIRVRPGFRFSPPSGAPVTAESVGYSLERAYSPKIGNSAAFLLLPELKGADAYVNHGAKHIAGIELAGDTVTLHLTRPVPDLVQILATPFFSVVPVGTPMTLLDEPIPSAGPYYLSTNDWYVILRRNPNYHGSRPQRLDALVWNIDVDTGTAASRVISGTIDGVYDPEGQVLSPQSQIARDYTTPAAGRPRYLRIPGRGVRFVSFNTDHGPLRDRSLRRAIGFAIDRPALAAVTGAVPDDQYLPFGMPGRSGTHVWPVDGPDLARAQALLHGRHPALTLFTCIDPDCAQRARILKANLAAVGIALRVSMPDDMYGDPLGYDLRDDAWYVDEFDPSNMLGAALFGQHGYVDPPTGFSDPTWKRREMAADRLSIPDGRFAAFGKLADGLERGPVPWAAYADPVERTFLAARVGCVTLNPVYGLDYAALCVHDHAS